jgi:hypothetical protein
LNGGKRSWKDGLRLSSQKKREDSRGGWSEQLPRRENISNGTKSEKKSWKEEDNNKIEKTDLNTGSRCIWGVHLNFPSKLGLKSRL